MLIYYLKLAAFLQHISMGGGEKLGRLTGGGSMEHKIELFFAETFMVTGSRLGAFLIDFFRSGIP